MPSTSPSPEALYPKLASHARVQPDPLTGATMLLYPEGALVLDDAASAILRKCDGFRSIEIIAAELAEDFEGDPLEITRDVRDCLNDLAERGLVQLLTPPDVNAPRPYGLLAELTHRCPLHCPYCSNPLGLIPRGDELPAQEWIRVLGEAAALGVLQIGFSGGEPLLYPELPALVAAARRAGLYTNLITSAIGLSDALLGRFKEAGLDTVQISFQSDEAGQGDAIAAACVHERKLAAARAVREAGLPLSVNVVLHRANIGRVAEVIALAESLGAFRIELANVQFYGWAFANRRELLPTRAQVGMADAVARRERERLRGRMEIVYVLPDYHEKRPKPCLHGWGSRALTVNPRGDVLPCQAAESIPGLVFENVRTRSLGEIWRESEAFNRFRGTEWLPEPCQSCDLKEIDFGGCRCQAALLAGDAGATDPVCEFSPDRPQVDALLAEAEATSDVAEWRHRSPTTPVA